MARHRSRPEQSTRPPSKYQAKVALRSSQYGNEVPRVRMVSRLVHQRRLEVVVLANREVLVRDDWGYHLFSFTHQAGASDDDIVRMAYRTRKVRVA